MARWRDLGERRVRFALFSGAKGLESGKTDESECEFGRDKKESAGDTCRDPI